MDTDGDGMLYFTPSLAVGENGLYILGHHSVPLVDTIGLLIFVGSVFGVMFHAGLRVFALRRMGKPDEPALREVYMYSIYERQWHWLQTVAIFGLIFTGMVIHKPDVFAAFGFRGAVLIHNALALILVINAALAALYHLVSGEIYATPAEILDLMDDSKLVVQIIDVRDETDFNLFHTLDAVHVPLPEVLDYASVMLTEPANTLFVLASNDETDATAAWRLLVAESVPNIYVLEGGINNWLNTFSDADFQATYRMASYEPDALAYQFDSALGSRYPAANPNPDVFEIEYTPVIEMEIKRGPASGGCG